MSKLTPAGLAKVAKELQDTLDQLRVDGVRVFDPEFKTLQESLLVLERIGKRIKREGPAKP